MQIRKNKKAVPLPAAETKRSIEARLAWAAGTDRLKQHDPLYHVTESFRQSFDRIGLEHARTAAGEAPTEEAGTPEKTERDGQALQSGTQQPPARSSRKDAAQAPRSDAMASGLTRFSELAFQRGAMSGAVLNGTGKLMLVSCLKRSAAEAGPKHMQQQTVLGTGSQIQNLPGHAPDRLMFNRGFANSALGIVTDTLRDARRVADSMTEVACGRAGTGQADCAAMFKLYPFLDDSRDAALEAEYREKLARCTDEREKPVLQNALVHTRSLRAKKAQMKNEFINKLRFLSGRAEETLSELETPGILDELIASAFGGEAAELPENPDEGADGDAPNGKKNRSGKAKRKAGTADAAKAKP
jgi:hypothetical protein